MLLFITILWICIVPFFWGAWGISHILSHLSFIPSQWEYVLLTLIGVGKCAIYRCCGLHISTTNMWKHFWVYLPWQHYIDLILGALWYSLILSVLFLWLFLCIYSFTRYWNVYRDGKLINVIERRIQALIPNYLW